MTFPFHLVHPSPWPLAMSLACFSMASGGVLKIHGFNIGNPLLLISFLMVFVTFLLWSRDVIREGSFLGNHTLSVKHGIRIGVILFIISEVMLFFSFFWAHFHSSLSPSIELGSLIPPLGLQTFNPFEIPLLNTLLLLSSGATITASHHALLSGNRHLALLHLILTLILASAFLSFQFLEYSYSPFTMSDSVFGSLFFLLTGFHGFHVLVGASLLLYSLSRLVLYHFTHLHHLGFEGAIWYWHFVDVVWLFLYSTVYFV